MNESTQRRQVAFFDFPQLLDEIDRCRLGHVSLGSWTLAQICRHLADTITGSMDGFNLKKHRMKRWFFGRKILKLTLTQGMPKGYTVDLALNPPSSLEFNSERKRLQDAIDRYQVYRGRLRPHPIFGRLSRAQWDELHLFHAAHHLGFVVPSNSGAVKGREGCVSEVK
ncbi:MAG: DUF1569 domain-containing protein [Planctomycetes bacterium]|nr:DUF1569 domain-containing protein [Planctomycetota bacterium]